MPFARFFPRTLTALAIHQNVPASSGVYGISNAREWLYIGQTDDLQGSLLAHLEDLGTPLMKQLPTGFVFELCEAAGRPARHGRLIREYKPTINRQPLRS